MGDSGGLAGKSVSLVGVLVMMLVAPVLIARCNQDAASTDLGAREVLIKPAPSRGGPEARFQRGTLSSALPVLAAGDVAGRLQAIREACASLPALEEGPLGRLEASDAEALRVLLAGLPYRDIVQRIDWAKPIIGADSHFQEVLISGGQGLGAFECTDQLAAAVSWSRAASAASGWPQELDECRRWGNYCMKELSGRLRINCRDPAACARAMRWREIKELSDVVGQPEVGVTWLDPFAGATDATLKSLVDTIHEAKLEQNPG